MEYVHQEAVERTYSLKKLQDCSSDWLRAISQEKVIASLLEKLIVRLNQQRTETAAGITTLQQTLNAPVRDAEAALETVARQLGCDDVVDDWRRAHPPVPIIRETTSLVRLV
jgi:alkylhydroperoxidase family enzyme